MKPNEACVGDAEEGGVRVSPLCWRVVSNTRLAGLGGPILSFVDGFSCGRAWAGGVDVERDGEMLIRRGRGALDPLSTSSAIA